MNDVTRILSAIERGEPQASEQLLPLVYAELRKLAARKLARERRGLTLQATALVHEAYLRLVDAEVVQSWDGRGHFFAAAAESMRRILVEQARRKGRWKHGGGRRRESIELDELEAGVPSPDVLDLDAALEKLARLDPKKAKLVELRFFAGLTLVQAAESLGISLSSADRAWRFARAWLYAAMAGDDPGGEI